MLCCERKLSRPPTEIGDLRKNVYSITIIHRHIPQGVRGSHKVEPTSPQLHSDFTPGCGRSFGQVYVVSGADEHLQSARQSPIIFMLRSPIFLEQRSGLELRAEPEDPPTPGVLL